MSKYTVIHGYESNEFDSMEQVQTFIKDFMDKQNVSYLKVSDIGYVKERIEEDIEESKKKYSLRYVTYQYWTLYCENFLILSNINIKELYSQEHIRLALEKLEKENEHGNN